MRMTAGGLNEKDPTVFGPPKRQMAIQLAHEIRAVPGIEFIPLPAEFQRTFVFFPVSPQTPRNRVIRANGMDPVAGK
jgi:hypothetical protein